MVEPGLELGFVGLQSKDSPAQLGGECVYLYWPEAVFLSLLGYGRC